MHDSERYILQMIEVGVHAFLLKNTHPEELERAIYTVCDKDFYHNDLVQTCCAKVCAASSKQGAPIFRGRV